MNFELRKLARNVALVSALTASGVVMAANDGSLGSTSTGDLDVTLSVADRVQISGLNDIALGAFDGTNDLTGGDSFCVYRNGTGLYDIEIQSLNNDAGTPAASNGTDTVTYTLLFDADSNPLDTGNPAVSDGDVFQDQSGDAASITCASGDNASIQVTFDGADLQAAPSGSYVDTITFVVSPS